MMLPTIKNATDCLRILNKRRRHEKKNINVSTYDMNLISSEYLLIKTHSVSRHLILFLSYLSLKTYMQIKCMSTSYNALTTHFSSQSPGISIAKI